MFTHLRTTLDSPAWCVPPLPAPYYPTDRPPNAFAPFYRIDLILKFRFPPYSVRLSCLAHPLSANADLFACYTLCRRRQSRRRCA